MKKIIIASLVVLVTAIMLVTGCGEEKVAENGDTVSVHYTGTLDDGTQFDSSVGKEPLEFVLGAGNMITGFENAVRGMKVGESKTVTLPPEEAYGQPRDDLLIRFDLDELPEGPTPQVGQYLVLTMTNGQNVQKPVVEVTDSYIIVDANHELAGKTLTFEIELVSIDPAE
jgi:peptidylprolyl isomerase